jgi:formamidopyrimidine-DNA glycosylase
LPELPEVETVCRGLSVALTGRRLTRVEARRPDLRIPLPIAMAASLEGRVVVEIRRRAKYILMVLDDGQVLICHLGMSGRMVVTAGRPNRLETHDHVVFETDDGQTIRYHDPRRFGLMALTTLNRLADHALLKDIGPEPLDDAFTGAVLSAALAGRASPIKAALLDQKTVAGVGNIYACEALFQARLSPRRLAMTVQGKRADALVVAIKAVLARAIAVGGSSLRDHVQPSGELGYFQHEWAVYGREGQACPGCDCAAKGGAIQRLVQSNRSTFFCAKRQR